MCVRLFFFDATATPEIYTLSLHDALPICGGTCGVFAALEAVPAEASVLLVGHEPDLARLAGAMTLEPRADMPLEFKKGGLCRIDFEGSAKPGHGRLVFLLTPKILRRLAPRTR